MADKYRNEKLDEMMSDLEDLLGSISGKECANLHVQAILSRDVIMPFDKAVQIGMRENAQKALVILASVGTSFDRIIAMVGQMTVEMENANLHNCKKYRKRLKMLLKVGNK